MTVTAPTPSSVLDAASEQLAELCGQINALQAKVVEIARTVEEAGVLGNTGCRSLEQWLAWQTGASPSTARQLATLARRSAELPTLAASFSAGNLSLDQASSVAATAPATPAADQHFTEMAQVMTVRQLRTALRAAVPPPGPEPDGIETDADTRQIHFGYDDTGGWRASIRTTAADGAHIEAGLRSHLDALHNEHKRHLSELPDDASRPRLPSWFDALERMVDRSLEREATDRPWSQRTRVLLHVDATQPDLARLHLGPALTAAQRALLTCDASIVTVLERDGIPVSVGREHRITPDRTRVLVEQRDGGCVIPWCRATNKLVTHHIEHWEHGGPTDTANLVCVCPFHHREIHAGRLGVSGNADRPGGLHLTDVHGRTITGASRARPPSRPPDPPPNRYRHPDGGRMDWRWYTPPVEPAFDRAI